MQTIFNEGKKQSIADVLLGKDKRVQLQHKIFKSFPRQTLVDIKLNIPGPIKNNRFLKELFDEGINNFAQICDTKKLHYQLIKASNEATGPENFYIFTEKAEEVKRAMVMFEDQTKLGRIFDADVLIANRPDALSRTELGQNVRKCFLCNRPAKDCARSRRHSVQELQTYINHLYTQNIL